MVAQITGMATRAPDESARKRKVRMRWGRSLSGGITGRRIGPRSDSRFSSASGGYFLRGVNDVQAILGMTGAFPSRDRIFAVCIRELTATTSKLPWCCVHVTCSPRLGAVTFASAMVHSSCFTGWASYRGVCSSAGAVSRRGLRRCGRSETCRPSGLASCFRPTWSGGKWIRFWRRWWRWRRQSGGA